MSNTTDYNTMRTKFICPAGMYCQEGLDRQPYPLLNPCKAGYYCVQGDEVLLLHKKFYVYLLFKLKI